MCSLKKAIYVLLQTIGMVEETRNHKIVQNRMKLINMGLKYTFVFVENITLKN